MTRTIEQPDVFNRILTELVKLQAHREFNALHERILECEELGGDEAEAATHFELHFENERYNDWREKNTTCGYDDVVDTELV